MANLLDSIQSYITPAVISQVATALQEKEGATGKTIAALLPTLLAGIMGKSGDAHAMGNIFNLLADKRNMDFLENPAALVGGGNLAHNDPKDIAGQLLGVIFGAKVPATIHAVASSTGVKSDAVSALLGMAGPLVMGVLSKKINAEGLNVSGLLRMLEGEKNSIFGALPGAVAGTLGLTTHFGATHQQEVTETAQGNNWLWPLLLLLALAGGIVYYMKNCAKMPEKPATEAPTMPKVDTVVTTVSGFMKKLASGFELKGNENGIESQLVAFIEDAARPVDKTTWFNFDRLLFETGSAQINMEKSKDQLANMVEIMKAFPNVAIKVGGYTDNTGSAAVNKKLSQDRADAVVKYLTAAGIDKTRMAAEGYGPEHPVASNDTEEGRAQNRRIAVRVTKK